MTDLTKEGRTAPNNFSRPVHSYLVGKGRGKKKGGSPPFSSHPLAVRKGRGKGGKIAPALRDLSSPGQQSSSILIRLRARRGGGKRETVPSFSRWNRKKGSCGGDEIGESTTMIRMGWRAYPLTRCHGGTRAIFPI